MKKETILRQNNLFLFDIDFLLCYTKYGEVMDIIIIGAGPAGLATAYQLLKQNKKLKVTILEESDSVGGISKTVRHNGNRMDLGGHRFFTKNEDVEKLWFKIMPLQGHPAYDDKILGTNKKFTGKKDPEKDDNVMLVRNRISRIFYKHKFFDYPVSLNAKTIKNMGFITTMKCGFSYIHASIFKKEESNLENFYINRFGNELYNMFFKGYTTKLWGRTPSEIDSSWGSQRVKGISIRKVLIDYYKRLFHIKNKNKETSLIESFYYPKYGPGELYEEMAKQIEKMGGKILLNSKVIKIKKSKDNIESVTYENNKKKVTVTCDKLVSSMPVKDLINDMNSVPKHISKISNDLPYRDFITIGVLVPKLDLKNETNIKTIHNNIPDNWIYIQDTTVKMGRIQIFNNWSSYMVKDPINTIWIGLEYFCSEGDAFWNLKDEDLVKIAKRELKKMGFYDGKLLDSKVVKVKKAYPAYFDSYDHIGEVREYINGINNLYCVGRNGTHSYNNMDHSILSGMICADLILKNSHDLDKLWNVNVDKSYHEEKSDN